MVLLTYEAGMLTYQLIHPEILQALGRAGLWRTGVDQRW